MIVDGGTFPWSEHPEKFPEFNSPDPSYHGVVFAEAVGNALAYIIKARVQLLRDLGASNSPDTAFALLQGIETLSLRIERHVQNAQEIAEWLDRHPDVATVAYAGLPTSPWYGAASRYAPKGVGAVLSFELKGGVDAGRALVDNLTLFSHLANIGDVRSLVIHPASTTHSQLTPEQQLTTGVTPVLVRRRSGSRTSRTSRQTSRPGSPLRGPWRRRVCARSAVLRRRLRAGATARRSRAGLPSGPANTAPGRAGVRENGRTMDWQTTPEDSVPSTLVPGAALGTLGKPPVTGAWRPGDPPGHATRRPRRAVGARRSSAGRPDRLRDLGRAERGPRQRRPGVPRADRRLARGG